MGLCLICQAAVSSTLKFISEDRKVPSPWRRLRHFRPATPRTTVIHLNQPCGAAPGASRPGHPFIPNRMTGTAPSSLHRLHGEHESRSEPSGECARCQAGYVNDRGHGRRLGPSAPRAFPSSALSGRRSCRWRWGGLEKRSQRRQSRPD